MRGADRDRAPARPRGLVLPSRSFAQPDRISRRDVTFGPRRASAPRLSALFYVLYIRGGVALAFAVVV